MRPLLSRLKPYLPQALFTLALVLVQALADLALPTLMAGIVDHGIVRGDAGAVASGGLWMLGAVLAGTAASLAAAWFSSRLGAGFGRDLRSAVFRKATNLSLEQARQWGASSLITRTTNDVTQVQSFAVMSLRLLASAPLMALGGLVMAFLLNPGLSWVLLVAVPLLALMITFVALKAVKLFQLVQKRIDRMNLVLRESLSGVRVLRAFDRAEFSSARFSEANLDLADVSLKTQKLTAVIFPGMSLAMSLSSIALVWFGGLRVEAGTLTIGELMAFIQYATQILFSLMMMSMLFVILPRAAVSAGRINEVLLSGEAPPDGDTLPSGPSRERGAEIEFRNVSFQYPGAEQPALDGVSFKAPAGKVTAIIGGTGSGKTTALLLVGRFHEATAGQVLVDGVDVKQWPRAELRRRLGLVPQRSRLFTGTVAENLRWGADAAETELREALEISQASEFVDELPGGLNEPVSKNGANLSGGQRQRLSIARALVRRPAALLLDDSFSALDLKTEAALKRALKTAGTNTVVLVAQRVASVRDADVVVVLDEGKVMAAGTHGQLLASSAVYREIAASQDTPEAEQ